MLSQFIISQFVRSEHVLKYTCSELDSCPSRVYFNSCTVNLFYSNLKFKIYQGIVLTEASFTFTYSFNALVSVVLLSYHYVILIQVVLKLPMFSDTVRH